MQTCLLWMYVKSRYVSLRHQRVPSVSGWDVEWPAKVVVFEALVDESSETEPYSNCCKTTKKRYKRRWKASEWLPTFPTLSQSELCRMSTPSSYTASYPAKAMKFFFATIPQFAKVATILDKMQLYKWTYSFKCSGKNYLIALGNHYRNFHTDWKWCFWLVKTRWQFNLIIRLPLFHRE